MLSASSVMDAHLQAAVSRNINGKTAQLLFLNKYAKNLWYLGALTRKSVTKYSGEMYAQLVKDFEGKILNFTTNIVTKSRLDRDGFFATCKVLRYPVIRGVGKLLLTKI